MTLCTRLRRVHTNRSGPVGGLLCPKRCRSGFLGEVDGRWTHPWTAFPEQHDPWHPARPELVAYLNREDLPAAATATGQSVESVPAPIQDSQTMSCASIIGSTTSGSCSATACMMHDQLDIPTACPRLGLVQLPDDHKLLATPSNSAALKLSGTIQAQPAVRSQHELRRQHHRHRQQYESATCPPAGALSVLQ